MAACRPAPFHADRVVDGLGADAAASPLDAVTAIGADLDLGANLAVIIEAATALVDADALGVRIQGATPSKSSSPSGSTRRTGQGLRAARGPRHPRSAHRRSPDVAAARPERASGSLRVPPQPPRDALVPGCADHGVQRGLRQPHHGQAVRRGVHPRPGADHRARRGLAGVAIENAWSAHPAVRRARLAGGPRAHRQRPPRHGDPAIVRHGDDLAGHRAHHPAARRRATDPDRHRGQCSWDATTGQIRSSIFASVASRARTPGLRICSMIVELVRRSPARTPSIRASSAPGAWSTQWSRRTRG